MTEQFVIAFAGNVYDSAYGRDEAKEVAKRCKERYPKSDPRVFIAYRYMRTHPADAR